MARTIWNNHHRYKEAYFSTYENMYFTGDGALRDEVGYYRITGRHPGYKMYNPEDEMLHKKED